MKNLFKRMNWGWGIAAVYSGFVIGMLALVWMASRQEIDYVETDYYNKELAYQSHIDKINRASSLKEQLEWSVNGKEVQLKFPEAIKNSSIKASILFYRPSESAKDFSVNISADADGNAVVSSDKFTKGVYRMHIDWTMNGISYYNEGVIHIN